MHQWSVQHRVFAVQEYIRTESIVAVRRAFRLHFRIAPRHVIPDRNRILQWVNQFRTTGSVLAIKHGRPINVTTEENVQRVRASVLESPRRSTRQRASVLGISRRSLQRILSGKLKLHPYKLMIVQKLLPSDYLQRQQCCERIMEIMECENVVLLMTDEAHFSLDGYVNKQNCRYWAEENPRQLHQRPLHSAKVTVWCGVSKTGIIGPYFFENEREEAVTVTSERYVAMLRDFVLPQLQEHGFDTEEMWFQQDGATAHTARVSMQTLRAMFPGKLISRFGDVPWSPRSPDLSACDFFLWGYLKAKVYRDKPRTIAELKTAIRNEIDLVPRDMLERVMQNFQERLQECIAKDGRHLSDIIFRS